LDGLKYINDHFGHQEGNRALAEAAEILKSCFRQSDVIGRLGGDEFAVLVTNAEDSGVEVIRTRLLRKLKVVNSVAERRYELCISVGILTADSSDASLGNLVELLARADALMYEEKRKGAAAKARSRCSTRVGPQPLNRPTKRSEPQIISVTPTNGAISCGKECQSSQNVRFPALPGTEISECLREEKPNQPECVSAGSPSLRDLPRLRLCSRSWSYPLRLGCDHPTSSHVVEQGHEAKVHVKLLMSQRLSWASSDSQRNTAAAISSVWLLPRLKLSTAEKMPSSRADDGTQGVSHKSFGAARYEFFVFRIKCLHDSVRAKEH